MKRWGLLLAIAIGFVIGGKLLLEDALGLDLEGAVRSWLDSAGAGSALLIVGRLAADVFLPVPSSLVMVLSGAAFGIAKGATLALAGSVAGEWLGFETLTLVPIDRTLLDEALLSPAEQRWWNEYHARVFEVLSPQLAGDDLAWLTEACRPL